MFQKYYLRTRALHFLFASICAFVALSIPAVLHAETLLGSGNTGGGILTKEGNPYILTEPITYTNKLIIKEGVVIMTASSTRTPLENYKRGPYIEAYGGVEMIGTEREPIRFIGLAQTLFRRPVSNKIEYVHFENSPLYFQTSSVGPFGSGGYLATTTIKNSKLINSDIAAGLEVNSGAVIVENSVISGNPIGVLSDITAYKTSIEVRNSSVANNKKFDIENRISIPMKAKNNWWGRPEGPGGKVSGAVVVEPWLTEDPFSKKIECCSNVLFLPGLQASRLHTTSLLGTNRLWEPNRNDDVRKLYLNPDGTSQDPDVTVGGIIDAAFGIKKIYKSFIAMMDGVVAEKTINEWKPFAYDWRMNVTDIARDQVVKEVERLASTSKTGKVTLIAHSNGGLLAKRLGYELERLGKSSLVDKAILVASPLLGTPKAAAAMLHGGNSGPIESLIMKPSVVRTLGQNMIGAYGLLPSREFFNKIGEPVISFAGQSIESYKSFTDFLTSGRTQPAENDLKSPAVLSPALLSLSESLHGSIDTWKFPTTTEELRLVGWGIPTVSSISYASGTPFLKKNIRGDSTVLSQSASDDFAKTMYINLGHYNFEEKKDVQHDTIFESDILRSIVASSLATTTLFAKSDSKYVTDVEPDETSPWMKWLTVSVHSPVDLHIYDSRGGHMGPVPFPDSQDSDMRWFENTIGGQVEMIGEEKFYTIPADNTYEIKLHGTGFGTFTVQIQKMEGVDMKIVGHATYTDLPVTPLMEVQTTISGDSIEPQLSIDVDGNGIPDLQAPTSTSLTPALHLDNLKIIVSSLDLESKEKEKLFRRIDKIGKSFDKRKEQALKKMHLLIKTLDEGHWENSSLTPDQKKTLTTLLLQLLDSLDGGN